MEKKPKKTKQLNVKIDTKHVDVELNKTETETSFKVAVDLDANGEYEFISNGTGKGLLKDKIYKVSGEIAKILISRGFGKLKK